MSRRPRGAFNRNLGRGFGRLNETLTLFKTQKYVNFATLSKRKCCNFLPCSRLDQAGVFKTLQTARKFAFSRIPTKVHEISENYVIEGGGKDKIYGDDPV